MQCKPEKKVKLVSLLKAQNYSWQQGLSLAFPLPGVLLGRCPDGKAECNLVHEVCKVVDQVQSAVSNTTHEVAEEVAKRIDGPANRHNEAHGAEGCLHILTDTSVSHLASLTCKDLVQDEAPAAMPKTKP